MIRYLFVLVFVLSLLGCGSMDHTVKDAGPKIFPVDFLDENIQANLILIDHLSERLPSGHVDVRLTCVSKEKKKPIYVDWKVHFFDSHKIKVEESEWHTEYLSPRSPVEFQVSSLRKDIAVFRFILRTPVR